VEKVYIDSDLDIRLLFGVMPPLLNAGCLCQLNVVWYFADVSSKSLVSARHSADADTKNTNELVTKATQPSEHCSFFLIM